MIAKAALSLILAIGLAPAANASVSLSQAASTDGAVVKVGEGCGAGWWRGPGGHCNPFYNGAGSYRGTPIECPPGFHIGPDRGRCWPNR